MARGQGGRHGVGFEPPWPAGAGSGAGSGAGGARRAPRLDASTYLAPYVTRRGRFRRVDPLRPRPLPGLARVVGALCWAVLLGESLRRAWKASRGATGPAAGAAGVELGGNGG